MRITLPRPLRCRRCGCRWVPRQTVIRMCPTCKSEHWQTKRTNRQGLRPEEGDWTRERIAKTEARLAKMQQVLAARKARLGMKEDK